MIFKKKHRQTTYSVGKINTSLALNWQVYHKQKATDAAFYCHNLLLILMAC